MTLAGHVRTLGRGPGRSRSLTLAEAEDAMTQMLTGDAAPEAVGALLMLLRMKGETPPEIAGFARAAQAAMAPWPRADLDWPCYAAGRTRGLPWFLLSARLVAQAGHRVLLHGWNGSDRAIRDGVDLLGIPVVTSAGAANAALRDHGIAYAPLEDLHPALFDLLSLRAVLGLRSCVNTVCRMLNPARAGASVQGVFHPGYRPLQAEAGRHLGLTGLSVLKGGGGEFERHPGKPVTVFGLRGGIPWQTDCPARSDEAGRLSDFAPPAQALLDLWEHDDGADFARDLVLGTAELALDTLGAGGDAARLWSDRHHRPTAA
ncbi:MAG: glycosyl transferase family protein [Marinibacterium sp.]|nr:glycosyl transferase family protein [Marinibacterium sp.]